MPSFSKYLPVVLLVGASALAGPIALEQDDNPCFYQGHDCTQYLDLACLQTDVRLMRCRDYMISGFTGFTVVGRDALDQSGDLAGSVDLGRLGVESGVILDDTGALIQPLDGPGGNAAGYQPALVGNSVVDGNVKSYDDLGNSVALSNPLLNGHTSTSLESSQSPPVSGSGPNGDSGLRGDASIPSARVGTVKLAQSNDLKHSDNEHDGNVDVTSGDSSLSASPNDGVTPKIGSNDRLTLPHGDASIGPNKHSDTVDENSVNVDVTRGSSSLSASGNNDGLPTGKCVCNNA